VILTAVMGMRLVNSTREVGPLTLRAEFVPTSLDREARTVELVWTTGSRVKRGGWFTEPFWEELSLDPKHVRMGRLQSGAAPLLNAHSSWDLDDVIGVVEKASLEKKRGVATVRFARTESGEKAFGMVADGIVRNVSVGYRVHKMVKVEDGDDKTPVMRAEDWEPYELSLVPIGADAGAGTRSAPPTLNHCVFVTRQEKATMDPEDTKPTPAPAPVPADPAVAATRTATIANVEAAKKQAEDIALAREAAKAEERLRAAEIEKIGDQSGLGRDWARTQIELGTSVEKARKLAFEKLVEEEQPIDGTLRIGGGDDERDKFVRGASAWLFERTGTRDLVQAAKAKKPELFKDVSFEAGEFRGYSPLELARLSLERDRVNTRGLDPMKIVGRAFTHVRSGNYQTIGDFPNILENVLGKVLLGAYVMQANTWERFCKVEEVSDFRTSNRYRTGSLPGLDIVPEHGEYKSGTIPDAAKYAITTERRGKMFSISEEVIVNDDMGALTQMAMELGKAAMRTIENAAYALLALNSGLGPTQGDGQPFFHAANRGNVNTVGSALSVDGIDADRVVMRAQKDPNGQDFIDLSPAILLVPDSLLGTARVINDAQYDPSVSNKFQVPNKVRGLFRDVVSSPRLSPSSTRRYLFAEPGDSAAMIVAFLAGKGRSPIMESKTGWRIDGTEWKVSLYAKAQMGDPKGAVTNAGT
jgi:hypothetical protein